MIGGVLAMKESDENELQVLKQSVLFGQTEITYSVNSDTQTSRILN